MPRYAARDGRFKYIWDSRSGSEELYDLRLDPRESLDRSPERPLTRAARNPAPAPAPAASRTTPSDSSRPRKTRISKSTRPRTIASPILVLNRMSAI